MGIVYWCNLLLESLSIYFLLQHFYAIFQVDAYPVYSMATPTVDGAREVLSYLGAKDLSATTRSQKVIIIDLREEAVVYINGSPFVLRELDRPVDTLKHVGISGSLVSAIMALVLMLSCTMSALKLCFSCRSNTWRQG